jgi:predicted dehydrogenase
VIASPTHLHVEHIKAVARAGKAIFTEKPVGLTLGETDLALQAVVDAGVPFQIGFQRRWDPRYQRIKRAIAEGQIGTPVLVKAFGRDPSASSPEKWGLDKNGGIFLNCAIHDFDAIRYLLGQEITGVSATGGALVYKRLSDYKDADTASTTLYLEGGAMAVTEWSRYATYGYEIGLEVVGTEGTVRFRSVPDANGVTLHSSPGYSQTVFSTFDGAFHTSIEEFAYRVEHGIETSPGVQDARVSLQVAMAARASFQGSGITLPVPPLGALQPRRKVLS